MRVLVFLGSVRDSAPPRPARLGLRVARACVARLDEAGWAATLVVVGVVLLVPCAD